MNFSFCITFFVLLVLLFVGASAQWIRGHWQKTWPGGASTAFEGANIGFAFSGYSDVHTALSESTKVYHELEGFKILTIGGGNYNGRWTSSRIENLNDAIHRGDLHHYNGIAYDIEEGDAGLSGDFLSSFNLARRAGLFVVVTVPLTAPYGFDDASEIVSVLVGSEDIHVLSPMMYASGDTFYGCDSVGGVSTTVIRGVPWERYAHSRAAVVPSIWRSSDYHAALSFLSSKGITTDGYITWC